MTTDDNSLPTLLQSIELEQLDRDLFLGAPEGGKGRMFGGFVAAQTVSAAYQTVEYGSLHSLHAYFMRPGQRGVPTRFVVYRIRDGRSFTTRDVTAYQAGEAIFNLSASFTNPEEGPEYRDPMPDVPGPEGLPVWGWARPPVDDEDAPRFPSMASPVELRDCDAGKPPEGQPQRRVWARVAGELPVDERIHASVIAYTSDRGIVATAAPLLSGWGRGMVASLDHAVWFHEPPRFDDWLLFTSTVQVARGARALIHGAMYRPDGTRVVSVTQEGLIRPPRAS